MEPELSYPTATPAEAAAPAAASAVAVPAYPTLKESWAVLGWYLLAMVVTLIPLFLLMAWQRDKPAEAVGVVLGQLGQAGIIWWLLRRAGARAAPVQWIGPGPLRPVLLLLVPLTVCVALSLTPLAWLQLPSWGVEQALTRLMQQPLLALLLVGVLAPVLEEWLFRGVLLPGLARNYGPTKAILQTSLLFGIIHFNPSQSLSAFLIGLFLGWVYLRTRSLWACILVHATNNILSWASVYWTLPGSDWQQAVTAVQPWEFAAIGAATLGAAAGLAYLHRLTRVAAAGAQPATPATLPA
jgi:membrane protease YdiL (CAAX protease family)